MKFDGLWKLGCGHRETCFAWSTVLQGTTPHAFRFGKSAVLGEGEVELNAIWTRSWAVWDPT
jgi:hypothetical protein